ncbi:hypothetical protein SAMN05216428_1196 [Nitrosospira sp. Nsp11]|nr:hypothetical protein SAMN05216428_1196 [Nitrosospira sp. Nsp11]
MGVSCETVSRETFFLEILGEPLDGRKSDHPEALLANTESRKYLPKQIVGPKFASNGR